MIIKGISCYLLVLTVTIQMSCSVFESSDAGIPVLSERERIPLIPLPASIKFGSGEQVITSSFGIQFIGVEDERLTGIAIQFLSRLEKKTDILFSQSDPVLKIICKNSGTLFPKYAMDESYDLSIKRESVLLTANNYIGISRGFESLLQLIEEKEDKWTFPLLDIRDAPRYPWRGIMIDVCRHWISKEAILNTIQTMASVKMNVLHLHLTDNQAFRIESKTFPKLHQLGSDGNYFTQEDMAEIISFAANRGIRIVPEFDMPGHTTSWLTGYPELAVKPGPYAPETGFGSFPAVFDPTDEGTYRFVKLFLTEMAGLFPDEYVHIGGDEFDPQYWEESDKIQSFLLEKGLKSHRQLQAYFNLRCKNILKSLGKKMIGWEEIIHPELAEEEVIIQSWRGQESLFEAVSKRNSGILSAGWHLNHNLPISEIYRIDPNVIPAVLTIRPDPYNWKAWEINFTLNERKEKGLLFLFGQKDSLRGVLHMMNRNKSFDRAKIVSGKLKFSIASGLGKTDAELNLQGDSLYGQLKIVLFDIPVIGKQIGGSDFDEGIPLPYVRNSRELTAEEKSRIKGGEACLWSEFITEKTLYSRLWPRTAAVAEKLWSPESFSNDLDDFYRRIRIMKMTDLLENDLIVQNQEDILSEWYAGYYMSDMMIFVAQLEVVKFNDRWNFLPENKVNSKLNHIADVALPESEISRSFSKKIEEYFQDPGNNQIRTELISYLDQWIPVYGNLKDSLMSNSELKGVEFLCLALSDLSKIAKLKMNNGVLSKSENQYYLTIRQESLKPRSGVLLKTAEPLIKLIDRHLTEL